MPDDKLNRTKSDWIAGYVDRARAFGFKIDATPNGCVYYADESMGQSECRMVAVPCDCVGRDAGWHMASPKTPPKRIQRQRTKGWKMPDKRRAKYVGRPTRWGNPFKGPDAVERYRDALNNLRQEQLDQLLVPLAGFDLVCWCPLNRPCHADVLLKYANAK